MHVLYLEDEMPLREIMKMALVTALPSVEFVEFANSDEAMAYIEPRVSAIDLYILDVRVPGELDGVEVARRIREMGGEGLIVLTSAYRLPDPNVLNDLNLKWFAKPWHVAEVMETLIPMIRDDNSI